MITFSPVSHQNALSKQSNRVPKGKNQVYTKLQQDVFVGNKPNKPVMKFGGSLGGPTGLSIDISGVKFAPTMKNKIFSMDPHFDASAVRIGNTYDNTFLKVLSPHVDINVAGISKKRFATLSTKKDLDALKHDILRPLTQQLDRIEHKLNLSDENRIKLGNLALNNALDTSTPSRFEHYLLEAEKLFSKAMLNPPNFEQGIYAQMSYAMVQKLLGNEVKAQQQYFSALTSMAESLPVLKKAAEESAQTPATKEAFINDLLLVQQRGENSSQALKNLFLLDYEILESGRLSKPYLESRVEGKDLSGVYFKRANDLKNAYLIGANLSNADLSQLDLAGKDLSRANLKGANLRKSNMERVNIANALIDEETDLTEASLAYAKNARSALLKPYHMPHEAYNGLHEFKTRAISGADFSGLDLAKISFIASDNDGVPLFKNTSLRDSRLYLYKCNNVDFSYSDLTETMIDPGNSYTGLIAPNFKGAKLTDTEFLGLLGRIYSPDFTDAVITNNTAYKSATNPILFNAIFDNTEIIKSKYTLYPGYNPTIRNMSPEKLKIWASATENACLEYITTPDDPTQTNFRHLISDKDGMHRGIRHTFRNGSWTSERVVSDGGRELDWSDESSLRKLREQRRKENESCIIM